MSYHMYTTEALVCGTYDTNVSDRSYLLFTKELGMLYATARSVREERSRQRYALQDFSLVRVSLVRGKAGWRIGSVVAVSNVFQAAPDREVRGSVTKVVRGLRRYVHGEEAMLELYTFIATTLQTIVTPEQRPSELYIDAVLFKMLYLLGYIAPDTEQRRWIDSFGVDIALPAAQQRAVRRALDNASTVSHL